MRPSLAKVGRIWALVAVILFTVAASIAGLLAQAGPDPGGDRRAGERTTENSFPDASSGNTSSAEQAPVAPTPATGELTAEEDLAVNPPPPEGVHVVSVIQDAVELNWDPPPPVAVAHRYSDRVVGYRIYRREGTEVDLRPLAVTSDTTYVDRSVTSGQTYAYVVSSVRERHVEGSRSDPPVTATLP